MWPNLSYDVDDVGDDGSLWIDPGDDDDDDDDSDDDVDGCEDLCGSQDDLFGSYQQSDLDPGGLGGDNVVYFAIHPLVGSVVVVVVVFVGVDVSVCVLCSILAWLAGYFLGKQ